ncbi:phosphoenolpyruvate synthase [Atopomonas sediminilitoris]|uniref:phosphoenolpyruvate synthase n=1 Tax=Atopomonas sediminilitoris TaxID=2919919 RepID=UPI001F4EC4A0|nr:phosphoenolpyruvate synthase [Atopomonas sediminilitoris]MCJ8169130.1 phosphoenolpyruvate synthase [Atopomonas sediminilitoris]
MSHFLYSQEQALFLSAEQLGGKAENLAWLSRHGLPVPRWWVLSTEAFAALLRANQLDDLVRHELAGIDHQCEISEVQPRAERIQQAILAAELPASLRHELQQAFGPNPAQPSLMQQEPAQQYAVRSSVLGEDAQGASFAGQMDSYLYQQGLPAIERSVLQVAASAFNSRALLYRLHKGLSLSDIRAAVIIQEMIDGSASGVLFTAHPSTGSRQHMLISAAWGCGEGVVAGICNADEFSVAHQGEHIEQQLADKDVAVVFDRQHGQGTQEITLSDEQRHSACLTAAQVLALRDVGLRIATLKGSPQDIEWTLAQGQVHILQTRPITSLPAPKQPVGRQVVFDNSNIQESYCGVTTPLTFSFANRAYATVYEQTMRLLGVSDAAIQHHRDMLDNMLGLIHGRIYYNINNWYRGLQFLPAFSTNKADMERMMGLTDPVDLIEDRTLSGREKLAKLPQMLRAAWQMGRGFRQMDARVSQFRSLFDQAYHSVPRQQLHALSAGELIELARRLDRDVLARWTTPIINDFYVMMMNGRVHRALSAAGVENPELVQNNLLSGEEGIESTEPTKWLLSMCADVRHNAALRELISQHDNATLLARVQVLDSAFYQRCLDYIERYGDRTMGELKLESITLRQDPSFLFAVLKNYLSRPDLTLETLAANEARFRQQAEQQAFSAVLSNAGRRGLKRFKKHLGALRAAIRNRENMRLARTRLFGLYRDIFLELGAQLALDGELANARDIFYLSLDELYALNDGRAVQTQLQPLVSARQAEYASYQQRDLPHHFHTWGMVHRHNAYAYPHAAAAVASDGALRGTGCYPGVVENHIRLIFSPDDELSLNGQILCTVRTDPGWAPLFPTAGGLLVERGSTLSHSAVVARELGIPAIVGIPGITQRLKDGQWVRMDGSSGVIECPSPDTSATGNANESASAGEVCLHD